MRSIDTQHFERNEFVFILRAICHLLKSIHVLLHPTVHVNLGPRPLHETSASVIEVLPLSSTPSRSCVQPHANPNLA